VVFLYHSFKWVMQQTDGAFCDIARDLFKKTKEINSNAVKRINLRQFSNNYVDLFLLNRIAI
jgi:hypothetical protein